MKTLADLFRVALPAIAAVSACACGGAEQVHAVNAGAASTQRSGTAVHTPAPTPNTPVAANVHISEDILRACNIPDVDAYFPFDSARLTAFDDPPLDAVATCFTRGPLAGRQMQLIGHADPRGAADYNMTLGQSRADSVATYLETRGLHSTAVTTTSRGAMDATGRDETGWAHDRRVDVLLGG